MSLKSVLVVDNDSKTCRSLKNMLQEMGYEATVLNNSSLVLAMLLLRQVEERPFDAVLLNLALPDGMTIVKKIKANPIFRGVEILALTNGKPIEVPQDVLSGIHRRISKPVDAEQLASALNAAAVH